MYPNRVTAPIPIHTANRRRPAIGGRSLRTNRMPTTAPTTTQVQSTAVGRADRSLRPKARRRTEEQPPVRTPAIPVRVPTAKLGAMATQMVDG
jgi:hypothetical protein